MSSLSGIYSAPF